MDPANVAHFELMLDVGYLTNTSELTIHVCMKTTLNIDDDILVQASRLTGVEEKTALVRMGLEALVARYSARRLAALGGSEPGAKRVPRRRMP
jgi:Arc/MetJ family transcription regulator